MRRVICIRSLVPVRLPSGTRLLPVPRILRTACSTLRAQMNGCTHQICQVPAMCGSYFAGLTRLRACAPSHFKPCTALMSDLVESATMGDAQKRIRCVPVFGHRSIEASKADTILEQLLPVAGRPIQRALSTRRPASHKVSSCSPSRVGFALDLSFNPPTLSMRV